MALIAATRLLALPAEATAFDPLLLAAHALLGLGIGFIGPPLSTLTLKDVPIADDAAALQAGLVRAVAALGLPLLVGAASQWPSSRRRAVRA